MQENHDWERKRKRAHATSLLKKPEEEKETMAELAIEAAATAAMRKDTIREVGYRQGERERGRESLFWCVYQETKKLSERGTTAGKEAEKVHHVPLVSHDQSRDIHDIIKEKGVSLLHLTS